MAIELLNKRAEKITDPTKMVTDPVLLNVLAKSGIDKNFVEFIQDYGKRVKGKSSPYMKLYQDLKSKKRFAVISGLPMVDADGVKIEVGWREAGINFFSEKNNLFRAKVQDTQVDITVRNDQPDGRKAGDKLTSQPQIFLNGIEKTWIQTTLLPIDPINPNYLENTIEWDYGICKRRLRLIEGSILGSWVFPSKPTGEVRIKYNQTGDFKLRLGQFKVNEDEEVITPENFDELALVRGYPVTISDSSTFYPDAHVETSSVDGRVAYFTGGGGTGIAWATLRGLADGNQFESDQPSYPAWNWLSDSTAFPDNYRQLGRSILVFDTSALPDDAVISAATFSVLANTSSSSAQLGVGAEGTWNVYSSAPASNDDLVAGDYDSLGATAYCNSPAAYTDADTWINFNFNATGIAAISLTSVTKLGIRNVTYDVTNTAPPHDGGGTYASATQYAYFAEQGAGFKPKLVIEYLVLIPAIWGFATWA